MIPPAVQVRGRAANLFAVPPLLQRDLWAVGEPFGQRFRRFAVARRFGHGYGRRRVARRLRDLAEIRNEMSFRNWWMTAAAAAVRVSAAAMMIAATASRGRCFSVVSQ